jgi:general secretion pathway protein A
MLPSVSILTKYLNSMYHQYFGLSEAPFSIAVNPRYLFMSARHRDALAHLLYGVGSGGGFILLTGEVGTGKTTINRALLEQLPQNTDIAIILNPALNALELLATACDELHIEYDPDNHTLKTLTDKLHAYLLANHGRGRSTVLMIDEAQHLDFDVLEQIRLLTNLETNTRKLLQIILIGQPELQQLLSRPELRQLNQRITARYNLEPLNQEETSAYIRHRLQVAGLPPGQVLFPPAVVRAIYRRTRGIPRLINVLCDRILLGTYGRSKTQADMATLKLAATEVMGEESTLSGSPKTWWPLALAALLLLIGVAWYGLQSAPPRLATASVSKPDPQALSVALPALPGNSPITRETRETRETIERVESAPEISMAKSSRPALPSQTWLLPPADAMARLWSLASSMPVPEGLCTGDPVAGVACIQNSAETWEELREFDRPLVLQMVTPGRFSASVLLLAITGPRGYVASEQGVELVELSTLGPLWSGRYYFFWHPPEGFTAALAIGDSSPVVEKIAALFAQLDSQETRLAKNAFNKALKERVVLFQRRHNLEDDGVVGVRTLLKLNEQLGIDMTGEMARSRLAGDAPSGVLL